METVLTILAVIFAGGMLYMLPKYAKFIHQQPKLHQEQMRKRQEEEANKNKSEEN